MMALPPDLLLHAYANGIFPMAPSAESDAFDWYAPDPRAILPIEAFHLPRRLARTVRAARFDVRSDTAFSEMVAECARLGPGREQGWISPALRRSYDALFARGHAHSVEVWADGVLAGGLFGVRIGGAFFGESMVSRLRDASKVALVHLVAALRRQGASLLDVQYPTAHLSGFGVIEIPAQDYRTRLSHAIARPVRWDRDVGLASLEGWIAEMGVRT